LNKCSFTAIGIFTRFFAERGKGTLIQRLCLDAAKAERDRLARTALEALSGFGVEADMLRMTARFIVSRGH